MQYGKASQLKSGLVLMSLLGALCFGGSAFAEGWGDKSWGDDSKHESMHMSMEGHHAKGGWDKDMNQDSEGYMTMRMRMVWNLDLDEGQRVKVRKIQRDLRAKVWALEDKIEDISDDLFALYRVDQRNAKKIGEVYGRIFDLRRQKIELMIEAGNDIEAILTSDQRKMLKKMRSSQHHSWGSGWSK